MSKRYRLLKDLPDCAAGAIFTHDGDDCYNYESTQYSDLKSWYKENVIQNNPEWFSEVEEEVPFTWEWTDELVKEFIMSENCGYSVELLTRQLSGFKQSKAPIKEEKTFSKEQMDKAISDAFLAGEQILEWSGDRKGEFRVVKKFPTLTDYLQTLTPINK